MLYLIKKDNNYILPYNIWELIKKYAGIYKIENIHEIHNINTNTLYSLYRDWFGRFILPDNYDEMNNNVKKKWLLKNLVSRNCYIMNENRYIDMMFCLYD